MTDAPCGSARCPVPHKPPTRLRSTVWFAGARLHPAHKHTHPAHELVPGTYITRFAQRSSSHLYVATTEIGALLDSALHDAAPTYPRIHVPTLSAWSESIVELRHDVRLFDLRDPELRRLGIGRDQLVSTPPVHSACTRRWASYLVGRPVGEQQAHGIVWHSRQAELHTRAQADRPAFARLLSDHPTEVAVVWPPPAPRLHLKHIAGAGLGRLDEGDATRTSGHHAAARYNPKGRSQPVTLHSRGVSPPCFLWSPTTPSSCGRAAQE